MRMGSEKIDPCRLFDYGHDFVLLPVRMPSLQIPSQKRNSSITVSTKARRTGYRVRGGLEGKQELRGNHTTQD